jgi:hypothetical protein
MFKWLIRTTMCRLLLMWILLFTWLCRLLIFFLSLICILFIFLFLDYLCMSLCIIRDSFRIIRASIFRILSLFNNIFIWPIKSLIFKNIFHLIFLFFCCCTTPHKCIMCVTQYIFHIQYTAYVFKYISTFLFSNFNKWFIVKCDRSSYCCKYHFKTND